MMAEQAVEVKGAEGARSSRFCGRRDLAEYGMYAGYSELGIFPQ